MIGRRRPLARAAMIGGGAYMVGKSNQKKNQQNADQEARIEQLEAQQQEPAPVAAAPAPVAAAPAPAGGDDLAGQISQLKGLLDSGVLSPEEFEAAKQKLLAQ